MQPRTKHQHEFRHLQFPPQCCFLTSERQHIGQRQEIHHEKKPDGGSGFGRWARASPPLRQLRRQTRALQMASKCIFKTQTVPPNAQRQHTLPLYSQTHISPSYPKGRRYDKPSPKTLLQASKLIPSRQCKLVLLLRGNQEKRPILSHRHGSSRAFSYLS